MMNGHQKMPNKKLQRTVCLVAKLKPLKIFVPYQKVVDTATLSMPHGYNIAITL